MDLQSGNLAPCFTAACSTKLGAFVRRKEEDDAGNSKLLGLCVKSVADHKSWRKDIAEIGGTALNHPKSDPEKHAPRMSCRVKLQPNFTDYA